MGFLVCKNAHSDHPRPLAYFGFKSHRISDLQALHIQDVLSIVCDQCLAVLHAHLSLPAHVCKLRHDARAGHGDDLHRQRKSAQHRNQFGFVGNANKYLRLRRYNFFTRERRAAALHHMTLAIDFIGAINVHSQLGHLIAIKNGNAQGL